MRAIFTPVYPVSNPTGSNGLPVCPARVGNGCVTLRPEPATQVDPDLGAPASARDERLQKRGRQPAPLCSRQTAAVRIQDLHAYMVCTGVKVGADPTDDRHLVAPGHDSIH
jgi:hypothetical protein